MCCRLCLLQPRTAAYQQALTRNPSLMAGARVLDVGCGTGILSLFAAKGGAAAVVGLDGSKRIAGCARQVSGGCSLKPGVQDWLSGVAFGLEGEDASGATEQQKDRQGMSQPFMDLLEWRQFGAVLAVKLGESYAVSCSKWYSMQQ